MVPETPGHDAIRMKRILFATNFTETSAAALPYAAAFARVFGAEICALHVIPPERYAHLSPVQLDVALREMKQDAAARMHTLLTASRFSDVPFRVAIEHGEILQTLAAFAAREDVDLIVAGSHGRHGIQKLISAAFDEEIASAATRPVLLIGPEVSIEPEAETHIHRILHATNFEPKSWPALRYAYALAETFPAELYLMHVAEDVWREPLSTRMTAEGFCRMRMLESSLPEHAPTLEPHFLVDFGPRESLILDSAEQQDVQLIVMGLPRRRIPNWRRTCLGRWHTISHRTRAVRCWWCAMARNQSKQLRLLEAAISADADVCAPLQPRRRRRLHARARSSPGVRVARP